MSSTPRISAIGLLLLQYSDDFLFVVCTLSSSYSASVKQFSLKLIPWPLSPFDALRIAGRVSRKPGLRSPPIADVS